MDDSSASDPVRSITAFDPVTIERSSTLGEAAAKMRDNSCSALLTAVRSGGVGVITERDIVLAIADHDTSGSDWVTDVMTRDVVTVGADTSIGDAAQLMLDAGIRHLIVHDEATDRHGIISIRDLVAALL